MNGSSTHSDSARAQCASGRPAWWGLNLALVLLLIAAVPAVATNVMPAGNSITTGTGSSSGLGFRDLLLGQLGGIGAFDFVGSSGTPPHEGHFLGGATVEEFYPGSWGAGHGNGAFDITSDMNSNQPDIVLLHVGTNDVNSSQVPYAPYSTDHGQSVSNTASGELGDLVKYLLTWHDGTNGSFLDHIIVSRIIPVQSRTADVETFNREVVRMVLDFRNGAATGTPEPVYLADHYIPFNNNPNLFTGGAGDWMSDALHPNDAGYAQMSDIYFEAVDEVLNDPGPPDAVTDLQVGTVSGNSMLVMWTNTGDSGVTGDPWYADVRYSTGAIDAGNFKTRSQAGDYWRVGSGGTVAGVRITGLQNSTNYTAAMKLMDDASNLSAMSNTVTGATVSDDDTYADNFSRTVLGPDWSADPEISVNGSELANNAAAGGAEFIAIFQGVSSPASAQFNWALSADQAGIDQAGLACRLEGTDPATANGYIVFRNVEAGQGCTLMPIVGGAVIGPAIDTSAPTQPTPVPGDEFRVVMSTDANGHHFAVYLNGALDGMLTDPGKLYGNGDHWAGYIGSGGLNDNIDDFQVVTVTSNLPPGQFVLQSPGNGTALPNLNPIFMWQESIDPNPGDQVTYRLSYSTSPSFPSGSTITISDLTTTTYGVGTLLQANQTFYWRVVAVDPEGETTPAVENWSFSTDNLQQLGDDFERAALGGDWNADAGFSIVGGELACTAPGFDDIAVYTPISQARGIAWTFADTGSQPDLDFAGAVFMDGANPDANGYFIFRKTGGSEKWSVFEIQSGLLVGSLSIDTAGINPIPAPGDELRVNYYSTAAGNVFECFINGVFDAILYDSSKAQANGTTVHAGLILGQNAANNVEDVTVLGLDANLPPQAFNLMAPGDGSILFSLAPTLEWEAASDPNPGDVVSYTVQWDLDPAFGSPELLPPTTATSTVFTGSLFFGVPIYWNVQAMDGAGAFVWSSQQWSFMLADTLSVSDDFNRADLGPAWVGDSTMLIVGNELSNTASGGTGMVVRTDATNPDAVQIDWGVAASNDGIRRGGIAVMLNEATSSPDGYWVRIDPVTSEAVLERLVNGGVGSILSSVPRSGPAPDPGPGDEFRITVTSDLAGHHFDCYVNGSFYARVSDPNKLEGNVATLYGGVALRGGTQNNADNFVMTAFNFGPPPQDFHLLTPAHQDTGVAVVSTPFGWEPASGAGTVYTVYVNTDSTFAGADSMQVQTDTSIEWGQTLANLTDYVWRVRATDGQESVFNLNGWHVFTTTSSVPVELARFEATGQPGRVVLHWEAAREVDHLGYHVWRSLAARSGYERLTDELVRGRRSYSFVDDRVEAGQGYYYKLEAVDRFGGAEFFGPVRGSAAPAPLAVALHQNTPNPFNPATTIRFDVSAGARVRLTIFDVAGRAVRRLVDDRYQAGVHNVMWDGRTEVGSEAGSGVYFYRLEVGDWSRTRKMLLVR